MIYPNNFEVKIHFNKIRELIKKNCLSSLGKEMVDVMNFSSSFNRIDNMINQTDEFVRICQEEDSFPVSYYIDVRGSLNKIKTEGTFLDTIELFNLKRSLESINSIVRFFYNKTDEEYPYLRKLLKNVKLYPYVLDRINGIITKHGKIKDNASPELRDIRNQLHQKQAGISKRMNSILEKAQKEGWVDKDISISIRDGRMVIPLPAANKRKISGIIHDESATGKTSFVEPSEIVEINNQVKELEYSERREIIKILTNFSNDIRPYIDDIMYSYKYLSIIDFIRAKALFAIQINALKPNYINKQEFVWDNAIHPLLYLSHKAENKPVVPLNIYMNNDERIILISGPNAGGKSVCLKTVGLVQYMFQCGLLVPVNETSKFGIFDNMFIDIGDEQSMDNDLSTYSSHLTNMKYFLKFADDNTLILIDEFGTGTEPMLGGSIAEAVLNKLNNKKTKGVITTHYTNLKHYASNTQGVENSAMLYDSQNMKPLYQLQIGQPGSSFAFEIAKSIGLPKDVLDDATQKIGEDHINFDKHLKDIVRDKRYWESKRRKIHQQEKNLDEIVEKYSQELKESNRLKKEIEKKAKENADKLFSEANKQIEKTIRLIKESNAEKEKTKQLRQKLEEEKDSLLSESTIDEKIAKKMKKLQDRDKKREKYRPDSKTNETFKAINSKDQTIEKGCVVRLDGKDTVGEVIEINDKTAIIALGNLMTTVDTKRLTLVSKNQAKKVQKQNQGSTSLVQKNIYKKRLSFKPDIDIRGQRLEEALETIMEHIDNAIMLDVNEVKILHGKGNGILRRHIREYLSTIDLVRSFRDEAVQFGGAGITVVTLG